MHPAILKKRFHETSPDRVAEKSRVSGECCGGLYPCFADSARTCRQSTAPTPVNPSQLPFISSPVTAHLWGNVRLQSLIGFRN